MPPRSYYVEPRPSDYIAVAVAFFPDQANLAREFTERTQLPYVESVEHLCAYIGVAPSLIRQIQHKKKYHYRTFLLPKNDGSSRQITSPKTYLKVVQWWIYDNILSCAALPDCVHGFRASRSFITNANVHLGRKHILNVDIKRFFPSITIEMVKQQFRKLGYGEAGAGLLADICTLYDCAPTGAPTSPALGNLVLTELDGRFVEFATSRGFLYTRYADDITFSSADLINEAVLDEISSTVATFGFSLNTKKTRFMGSGDRQEVTGLVINHRPTMPREWRNQMRGYLHRVLCAPDKYLAERNRVLGVYGTLKMLDPNGEQKLTRMAATACKALSNSGSTAANAQVDV